MIDDLAIAGAIGALYADAPKGFDVVEETGGIFWGLKRFDEADLVVARGSITLEDYARDAASELGRALAAYPALGLLPLGFSQGIAAAYAAVGALLRADRPLACAGHSLGAVHATYLAALHRLHGGAVARLMLCGTPRPGTARLAALLGEVSCASYRNRGDPVPAVPVPVPELLPWTHLAPPFRALAVAPGDRFGPLAPHHWALYQQGIAAAPAAAGESA
jgi:hypothetical protein